MSWEMVKLSEVSSFIRNGLSIKQDSSLSGVPITRIETISDRTVNLEKCGYADLKPTDNLDYKLEKGDILISHINSPKHLGKSAQFHGEEHLIHGMNLLCLRPSDKVDARYLYLAINSSHFLNQLPNISNKSVNQASFKVSDFKSLNVHLPPLPEQQRIADILDKAEAITQKRAQVLALCDEFLRATFLDMFGDPVSNTKGWSTKPIKEVMEESAVLEEPENQEKVWMLNLDKVESNSGRVIKKDYLEYSELKSSINYFDSSTVLYCKLRPYLNKVVMPDERGYCTSELVVLKADTDIVNRCFLTFYLRGGSFVSWANTKVAGAKMPRLNMKDFWMKDIYVPPIELQQKFSEVVEKVNGIKARIQEAQELPLFDALSQQAFKGELTQ